jgi:hypothetical protein
MNGYQAIGARIVGFTRDSNKRITTILIEHTNGARYVISPAELGMSLNIDKDE